MSKQQAHNIHPSKQSMNEKEEGAENEVRPVASCPDLEKVCGFPIIYQDDHICVINKPAGLNTIPGNKLVPNPVSVTSLQSAAQSVTCATSNQETDGKEQQHQQQQQQLEEKGVNDGSIAEQQHQPSPVPKAAKKRTHQELWIDMLQDHASLQQALGDDQGELKPYLERLSKSSVVPRKRQRFVGWALRTLNTTESKADEIFSWLAEHFEKREGTRADSVLTRMLQRLKEVKTVHRLDCETSGVCVLALTVEAARCLTTQFKEKLVKKTYLAIVEGDTLPSNEGEISLPIRPDYHIRPKQRIDPIEGKEARTIYRKLAVDKERGRCKMELIPYTGRTHQLRLHMAGLGYPILGDSIYSAADRWVDLAAHSSLSISDDIPAGNAEGRVMEHAIDGVGERLHLHAHTISFNHPNTNEPVKFVAECPF